MRYADRSVYGLAEGRAFLVPNPVLGTEQFGTEDYLQNDLGFPEPVVLSERPSFGKTIIEKFEHYARNVDVTFVLFTPDDVA